MSDEPGSFIMYNESWSGMQLLSREQRGDLLTALMAFNGADDCEMPEMDQATACIFAMLRPRLEANRKKYQETVEKRKEGGKLGGRPASKPQGSEKNLKVSEKTSRFYEKPQGSEKNPVSVSDPVSDNDLKDSKDSKDTPLTPQGDGGDTSSQNQPSDVQDSPSTYPDYEDYTFLRFYKVYPNKARKQKAYEAWIALRDKGWLPPFDDLIHSLKAQVNHYGWNLPGREVFCESLDKWLTGRRWEDDCPDTPYVPPQRDTAPPQRAQASSGGFDMERQRAINAQVLADLAEEENQKRLQEKTIEN